MTYLFMSISAPRTIIETLFDGKKENWAEWSELFLDAADGKGDDDYSWKNTLQGTDRQIAKMP